MSARRLRRVGTRGDLVDPDAVVAIQKGTSSIELVLACGKSMPVVYSSDIAGGRELTREDVDYVVTQLTASNDRRGPGR